MSFEEFSANWIYDRTDGRCHICGKKLSFFNYGQVGFRGAWEVEHSVPRALGGTDCLQNLFSGCISCIRSKGIRLTKSARARHGRKIAPLSKMKKQKNREANASAGVRVRPWVRFVVLSDFWVVVFLVFGWVTILIQNARNSVGQKC